MRINTWFISSFLISIVVVIPILTVFSSFFEDTSNYFEILRETFFLEYLFNSLFLLFGVLLGLSDFKKITKTEINLKDAFLIGVFQALAIIPGVSRSGAVITAGRFLGYSRFNSSKFSLFLSIPVIISATTFEMVKLYINDEFIFIEVYLIGIILTFIVALTTIKLFMNYIERISLKIFVIYRVFLGLVILLFVYFN